STEPVGPATPAGSSADKRSPPTPKRRAWTRNAAQRPSPKYASSWTTGANGTGPRSGTLVPLTLATHLEPPELPPYAQLLLNILTRTSALSIRADEAEESWRVVTPVLDAWSNEQVPLQEYSAGSHGPPRPPS